MDEVLLVYLCEDVCFDLWVWIMYKDLEESDRFGSHQFLESV